MRKILISMIMMIVALGVGMPAFAQDVKIAVVNTQRILSETNAAKSMQQKIATSKEQYEADLMSRGQAIESMGQKLEKESAVMTQEAIDKVVSEAQAKVEEFRKKENEYGTDLANKEKEYLNVLQNALNEVVTEIAQKNNYTVVLNNMSVVYSQKVIDITDEVIKNLNAKNIDIK